MRITLYTLFLTMGIAWSANPPNFVLIFLDDQGYNDLSSFGSQEIKTPKIDAIAAQGAKFTSFYSASSVCTPSRAGLLTGSYARRVGNLRVLFPRDNHGLDPNELTIADLLKRRGYMTAAVGKWHLGDRDKFLPTNNGFDSYYGVPYSNDMEIAVTMNISDNVVLRDGYTRQSLNALLSQTQQQVRSQTKDLVPLLRDTEVIEYPADQAILTERYTDEGIKFIAKNAQEHRPFFLYLAHTMPHIPLFVTSQFQGTSTYGLYGDVIHEIDYNVGRITDTLKALGIDSNTLLIYTSDNGPWDLNNRRGGLATPLRGFKFHTWEGGHRVPTVMMWPGKIPAGLVQDSIAASIDLLPTFMSLAGVTPPTGETIRGEPWKIDGKDISDLMMGKAGASRGAPFFYQRANNAEFQGVREGMFKLRLGVLYDLENDIHEDNDVSNGNGAIKNRLQGLLDNFVQEVNNNFRTQGDMNTPDPVKGCTNPDASNYNSNARQDNNTCVIVRGCTEPLSPNYNQNAVQDDGSCLTPIGARQLKSNQNFQVSISGDLIWVFASQKVKLSITTSDGKKVFVSQNNQRVFSVDKSSFTRGIYVISVKQEKKVLSRKITL